MIKIFTLSLLLFIFNGCSEATSRTQYNYTKATGDGIAAKVGDITISEKELMTSVAIDLYKKEIEAFDIKFNRLNALIVNQLVRKDPNSKGLTNDQYFKKYIISKLKVTDKDIKEFMKRRNIKDADIKDGRIKERINQIILNEKRRGALEAWMAKKTKKTGVNIFFEKPIPPSFEVDPGEAPSFGNKDAKVTLVEFSDFQCPACAKAAVAIRKLKKKYGKKLRVVYKHYPLPIHTHAKTAALASMCANEQGSKHFWKMHDKFFFEQEKMFVSYMKELAKKLGLDSKKFDKCFDEKKYIAHIEKDIQQGKSVGVKGTPSIYINGKVFVYTNNFDKYVELIEEEFKRN